MAKSIIARGAEAILYKKGEGIVKERIRKGYRLKELDEKLRKQRTRKEAKLLAKASKLINTPKLISMDESGKLLEMEFIDGKKLSDCLDGLEDSLRVCKKIGEGIAKLHDKGIIHGDLTTSNMILKEGKVYFVDFGLGFESLNIEHRAVDLHLIKQALEARHFSSFEEYWRGVLKGYNFSKDAQEVLKRLEKVEKRGRYKQSY